MITNNPYNILIVDDIPDNLQIVSDMLHQKGINISFATNGKQALKTAFRKKLDLILLDIAMPEMDGFQVCKELKNNDFTKNVPVIFLTAKNDEKDIITGFEIGAVDYITKPFKQTELLKRVFTHLELKRSRDIITEQNEELNKQNELLDAQNKELIELNNTKNKFFSIIAHDLKNPFNTINGFTDLLEYSIETQNWAKVQDYNKHIAELSKQGYNLLLNLLEWARTQTGRIQNFPEEYSLFVIVQNIIIQYNAKTEEKNIKIINEINESVFVFVDENILYTILRNIVSNALKFCNINGSITISSKFIQNNFIEIEIKDTGVGMLKTDLEKLFKLDIHHSTLGTSNEKGTGLGLILCKELVEVSKGTIRAESEIGKGSSFFITIPCCSDK